MNATEQQAAIVADMRRWDYRHGNPRSYVVANWADQLAALTPAPGGGDAMAVAARRMLDYSDCAYVPNAVFEQLRSALAAATVDNVVAYQYHSTLTLAGDADEFMRCEGTPLVSAAEVVALRAENARLWMALDALLTAK